MSHKKNYKEVQQMKDQEQRVQDTLHDPSFIPHPMGSATHVKLDGNTQSDDFDHKFHDPDTNTYNSPPPKKEQ